MLDLCDDLERERVATNHDTILQAETQKIRHISKWIWVLTSKTGFLSQTDAMTREYGLGGPSRRPDPAVQEQKST